jgi:hypothetical protein
VAGEDAPYQQVPVAVTFDEADLARPAGVARLRFRRRIPLDGSALPVELHSC